MSENPYGLRVAVRQDFDALLDFVLPLFREDSPQPISVPRVAAIVERCVAREGAIAGIVTGPMGIEASVGATIDVFDWTDDEHCMVRWLGVAPAFRRSDRFARMMNYVRWLYETIGRLSDKPVPVFLPALTTAEQGGKLKIYARRAPQVGVLHAFGCLPDRAFLAPDLTNRKTGAKDIPRSSRLVAAPDRGLAGTG